MITATDCCLVNVDLCRRIGGLNIIPACWGGSTEQGVRQRAKARLQGKKSQPSLKWIMPLYRITACLTSCISAKERRFSLYKHVFSQCCSFLQSHPVISKSIIPTDKVKKPVEDQLLKIVVIPCTLSDKPWRICFKRKHWKLTNIQAEAEMTCSQWPGAEAATLINRQLSIGLSVWLMKAVYSEGRATVGCALLPGRVAFDQTLSTPDIYTLARFATCHKTSTPPLPSHTGQGWCLITGCV